MNVESLRPPLTGIGNYTRHVLAGLADATAVASVECFRGPLRLSVQQAMDAMSPSVQSPEVAPRLPSKIRQLVRRIPGAYGLRTAYLDWLFQRHFAGQAGEVYHEPNYVLRPYPGPAVVTVHDVSHVRFPQFHPPERVRHLDKHLGPSVAAARRVLVVSEFAKGEVVECLGVPASKVDVTPLGVGADYRPRGALECQAVLARHGLRHGAYLLSVATMEPRKNLEGLLNAYEGLPTGLKRRWPLVLVGGRGWLMDRLEQRIQRLVQQGWVRQLGYVPATELPVLTAGAGAFAFVSHYEGFGLPLLESMASGVASLASRRASLPEVGGAAPLYVEPDSDASIREGLVTLLSDEVERRRRAQAGIHQAALFSWAKTTAATLESYRRALS